MIFIGRKRFFVFLLVFIYLLLSQVIFATAFMDIGIFTDTRKANRKNDITEDDLIIFKTIGIEGYGIVNKFPSYPIRASLGFNLDDVIKHVKGDIGFTDIEFELTIGMGLHY